MILEGDCDRDGAVCVRQAFTPEQMALIASELTGSEAIGLYHDHVLVKNPAPPAHALAPGHPLFPLLWRRPAGATAGSGPDEASSAERQR